MEIVSSQADRVIPVLLSVPNRKSVAPTILFSHGLGGSREAASYLREHWTARGYITIFLQHSESDISLWLNVSRLQAGWQLRNAAGRENLELRVTDVTDVLSKWNSAPAHPLSGGLILREWGYQDILLELVQHRWLLVRRTGSYLIKKIQALRLPSYLAQVVLD